MRRVFVPHKSRDHRLACLSLYRALLRASTDLSHHTSSQGHTLPTSAFHGLIRHRFRQDSRVDKPLPPTAVAAALTHGHITLSLLHDATTSPAALSRLLTLLQSTSTDLSHRLTHLTSQLTHTRPIPKRHLPHLRHITAVSDPVLQRPPSNVPGVFGPPLPLSQIKGGKRKVPHMVTTSVGLIPMLRYKIGRAPPWLRRVVRQKANREVKGTQMDEKLEMKVILGSWEDRWDGEAEGLVGEQEAGGGGGDGSKYESWPKEMRAAGYRGLERRRWEGAMRGWKLWQKVKRERWLSEREGVPERLARCVKEGQELQRGVVRVMAWRKRESGEEGPGVQEGMPPWRSIEERDGDVAGQMMRDLEAMGQLEVPVEWSEKAVERTLPQYLVKEAERLKIDWRAQMPRLEYVEGLEKKGIFDGRPSQALRFSRPEPRKY